MIDFRIRVIELEASKDSTARSAVMPMSQGRASRFMMEQARTQAEGRQSWHVFWKLLASLF